MIEFLKTIALISVFVMMASCIGQSGPDQIPVVDHSEQQVKPSPRSVDSEARLPETEAADLAKSTDSGIAGSSAVTALLARAGQQKSERHYAQAGATLERAIRVSPRSAEIYYQLAEIRLLQEDRQQAQQLCLKAVVLAGHSSRMQKRCSALEL